MEGYGSAVVFRGYQTHAGDLLKMVAEVLR